MSNVTYNVDMPETTSPAGSHLDRLFATRRRCYFVPVDALIKGRGWRPSVVFENEAGHYPMGDWPYDGKPGQREPWFWGPTYEDAVAAADDMNERMGVSKKDAFEIVNSSMRAGRSQPGSRRRKAR
jgi:hypothetical protein